MSDLVDRILAAIQAQEDTVPPLVLKGRYVGPRTDAERDLLRLCVAVREMVALHKPDENDGLCNTCGLDGQNLDCTYPCDTLRVMASGYGLEVDG